LNRLLAAAILPRLLLREILSLPTQEFRMRRPIPTKSLVLSLVSVAALLAAGGCPGLDLGLGGGTGSGTGGGTSFNLPPTVRITADVERGVAPLRVLFSSSSSSDDGVIVSRVWDFADGTTSQEISPTHVFNSTGNYVVRLTLTDDRGSSSSNTITIRVTEAPVAVIDVSPASASAAPAEFTFDGRDSYDPDAASGDTLSYLWEFGDGATATQSLLTHTFSRSGAFRVTLTVTDAAGVTDTAVVIVEVGIPTPEVTFRNPPARLDNLTLSPDSPLWTNVVFDVSDGVPYFLSAGLDGDLDTCDAQTAVYSADGLLVQRIKGHTEPVNTAAFSPSAAGATAPNYLLTSSDDGTLRLYSWVAARESWSLLRTVELGERVTSVAFGPNGERFVVGTEEQSVLLYETNSDTGTTDQERSFADATNGHRGRVLDVAYAPDGSVIASADQSGRAVLWDPASGARIATVEHASGQPINSIAFTPDSQQLLTASDDAKVIVWNAATGAAIPPAFEATFDAGTGQLTSGHSSAIKAVAVSADGGRVLTGGADNVAIFWALSSRQEVNRYEGHDGDVVAVAIAPDGAEVMTGSTDGTALLFDAATAEILDTMEPCSSTIAAVDFSPDGAWRLTGVAAHTAIMLDTDPAQGDDLNLTLPTALDISDVSYGDDGRQYYLFAEIDTDRTAPTRTYADTLITVIPPFTTTIDTTDTPDVVMTLIDEGTFNERGSASVVLPATRSRQVFKISRISDETTAGLEVGDRLFVNLLSLPGYGQRYDLPGFALQIFDDQSRIFAWYNNGPVTLDETIAADVLFSSRTKLVLGRNTDALYFVVDGVEVFDRDQLVPSVEVQLQRGAFADSQPRDQIVYLNFEAAGNLAFADSALFNVRAFDVEDISVSYDNDDVKNNLVFEVTRILGAYGNGIQVRENPLPAGASYPAMSAETAPFTTIYFDTQQNFLKEGLGLEDSQIPPLAALPAEVQFYGMPNFIDPRNETLRGRAVVLVQDLQYDEPLPVNSLQLGTAIGRAAAHQIGRLLGLRATTGAATDIMCTDNVVNSSFNTSVDFLNTEVTLVPLSGTSAIGTQNAHLLLTELVGGP
jgi:WD40 repeat protein